MRAVALALVVSLAGCTVPEVDLEGRPCPCVDGYVCDEPTNTCMRTGTGTDAATDAPPADSSAPDSATPDVGPGDTSAVGDTGVVADTSTDATGDASPGCWRDDFDAPGLPGWTVVAGDWSQSGGEAIQSNDVVNLSFMFADELGGTGDFRATTRMRQTSGSRGGALEICFRTNPSEPGEQYFCNWEPNNAQMVLMRGDAVFGTRSLQELDLDVESSPGWDALRTFTMVLEVEGNRFRCWIEEVPGTEIVAVDRSYDVGAVGLKTYQMAGAYEYLEVCPLP